MNIPTFTVLIVEDLAADRELYRRSLRQDSSYIYDLLEVESVAAGLALCQTRSIDAVLLDFQLPDGNGLEFLSELSVQSNGRMPPVIMMTGQGNESTAVRAMKLGAEDYVVKGDLTPDLLQLKVRRAIESSRRRQQQQQVELSLQAANKQIKTIWESMTDAYMTIDPDWRIVYANPAATEIYRQVLGSATAEFLGKSHWEVLPWSVGTILEQEYRRAIADGVAVHFELFYEPSETWFDVRAYPSDVGLGIYFQDITERKRDEELLRQSEELKRRILESSRDCIKVVDLAGRLIYMNDYGQSLMEIDDFSTVARSQWLEFWQDSDRESARTAFSIALVGEVGRFDGYCATHKGTPKWWEVIVTPILGADGQVSQILSVSRDITDRKQAALLAEAQQATIQQQLSEIETIYQTAPVGLCFVDTDLRFVRLNERLAQINGLPVSAHIGRTLREALPTADILEPLYRQVIESGEPILDLELSGIDPTQPEATIYCIVSYYPQKDAQGRVVGVNTMVQEITDRKRQEAALRASERMRRFMFEQTFEMIGLVDLDGVLIEVNQAALDSISAQQSEIVGRKFWEAPWWHTEQLQQQLIDAIDRAARGEVMCYEVQFPDGKGNVMTTEFSLKPLFDEDGQIVKLIAEGRDITDRKQMEAALRQRESQLKLFVQHVPAGVAMFDRDMRYLAASDLWIDWHDLADRDIVGQSHYDLYPNLPQQWKEVHQRCLAGAMESCEEDLFPRADGSSDWVRWEVRPWYTNPDEVGGIIIFSQIVTDRKIAAQRLQDSEQRLRTGVEVAGMGLLKFDLATDLFELSPEAAALYGFAPDTSVITREQLHATFHPDERAELEAVIAQEIDPQGTGLFVQDHRVVWPNGEVRCLSVRKQVYFDRSGAIARPSYAIIAAIDVTDRNQTQADLEERNRELDSFVFVVSHDLKAPLRAVANLSQWIEDDLEGQLTADTRSHMNLLRSRVNRMSATIDGLLDYARVGRSEDEIELVELAGLLADVIDSIAPPLTFTIDLPTELPTFSTKPLPLFQVFVNLVGNGIKHHHSEAGTIQISIEEQGDFYEFAIADDGSGIAPEHHDRMFKIFQAVNPQKRSDSTGIGLAIVKKIIEAEGGTIRLESELGKGTTFYFTWPKRSGLSS